MSGREEPRECLTLTCSFREFFTKLCGEGGHCRSFRKTRTFTASGLTKPTRRPQITLMNAGLKEELSICVFQRKSAANWFSCGLKIQFIRRLRKSLAVAFLNPPHRSQQMAIRSCAERFALPVEHLHHQRIKDAHLRQCCHVATDAPEALVQTVEKVINVGFLRTDLVFLRTARISVSHRSPFFGR